MAINHCTVLLSTPNYNVTVAIITQAIVLNDLVTLKYFKFQYCTHYNIFCYIMCAISPGDTVTKIHSTQRYSSIFNSFTSKPQVSI